MTCYTWIFFPLLEISLLTHWRSFLFSKQVPVLALPLSLQFGKGFVYALWPQDFLVNCLAYSCSHAARPEQCRKHRTWVWCTEVPHILKGSGTIKTSMVWASLRSIINWYTPDQDVMLAVCKPKQTSHVLVKLSKSRHCFSITYRLCNRLPVHLWILQHHNK